MPRGLPRKRFGVAALLIAEVAVLALITWSASSGPVFGVAVPPGDASITMTDQRNVVHSIHVDKVVSPGPGWVIVQADWNEGVPDAVVGSRWVPAGESRNVDISLNPHAPMPRRIYVTLLADKGKPHVLEYYVPLSPGMDSMRGPGSTLGAEGTTNAVATKDKPIVSGGKVVTAHVNVIPLSFAVGPEQASIAEATATPDGTSVVIPRVVAPAQSWISVSIKTPSGQPGELLGTKLVSGGVHTDVVVPLKQASVSGPVISTLHVDLGTLGQFDFSPLDIAKSPDRPYSVGGQPVTAAVHMTN